jgi:hypothetical protein
MEKFNRAIKVGCHGTGDAISESAQSVGFDPDYTFPNILRAAR